MSTAIHHNTAAAVEYERSFALRHPSTQRIEESITIFGLYGVDFWIEQNTADVKLGQELRMINSLSSNNLKVRS